MNAYVPYKYNKNTNMYEPELRVNFARFILMDAESEETVETALENNQNSIDDIYNKLLAIESRLDDIDDSIEELKDKLKDGISNTLIIQLSPPDGDERRIWINPSIGVAHYYDGVNWQPIAGTAV